MGQKVHPIGLRLGIISDWRSKWYADRYYTELVQEDIRLRKAIESNYPDAGISGIDIERSANEVVVAIHTSRPGVVIGRGGQRVEEVRASLGRIVGKRVRLNIQEIRQPELNAYLVAKHIADQIEHQVSYRRAMKQAVARAMEGGAQGIKISCSGRLGGVEIARHSTLHEGRVPLHTLHANIDYGFTEAHTTLGRIGVKVWIYKGDILPEVKEVETPQEGQATVEVKSVTAKTGEIS